MNLFEPESDIDEHDFPIISTSGNSYCSKRCDPINSSEAAVISPYKTRKRRTEQAFSGTESLSGIPIVAARENFSFYTEKGDDLEMLATSRIRRGNSTFFEW